MSARPAVPPAWPAASSQASASGAAARKAAAPAVRGPQAGAGGGGGAQASQASQSQPSQSQQSQAQHAHLYGSSQPTALNGGGGDVFAPAPSHSSGSTGGTSVAVARPPLATGPPDYSHLSALEASSLVAAVLAFNSLTPTFPAVSASSTASQSDVLLRLLSLSSSFASLSPPDMHSSAFYAFLALAFSPSSVQARVLLASAYLASTLPFPLDAPPLSSRAGAHAALELLLSGPASVFNDSAAAALYARACSALGRYDEAAAALRWTADASDGEASSSASSSSASLPQLQGEAVRAQAHAQAQLAQLAYKSGRHEEAGRLSAAAGVDAWNWSAWCGRCDVAMDPPAHHAFSGALSAHKPHAFFPALLLQRLAAAGIVVGSEGELSWAPGRAPGDEELRGGKGGAEESETTQRGPRTAKQAPSAATATTAARGTAAAAQQRRVPPHVRPGTRAVPPSAALSAGTKRLRGAGAEAASAGTTRTAPAPATTAASLAASRGRAAPRQGLASGRTNEQPLPAARPASAASGASARSTTEEEKLASHAVPPVPPLPSNISASATRRTTRAASSMAASRTRTTVRSTALPRTTPAATSTAPSRGAPSSSSATSAASTAAAGPRVRKGAVETSSASSDDAPLGRRAASDAQRLRDAINLCLSEAAQAASAAAAHWSAVDGEIVDLLRTLGEAYGALRRHLGRKATWLLRPLGGENTTGWKDEGDRRRGGLPAYLRDTPHIRLLLGVAAREMGRYQEAESHFVYARKNDASLMAQMDVFSIVLFHLAREVSLSKLAMELALLDPDAAQTHIAIGNAFALQREHAPALRSFRRAALAAPEYAYAYALAGHEAKALAQQSRAVAFYRAAIRCDQRCWIAWAGLADVYWTSANLDLAEYHWRTALAINTDSAVLWDLYGRCQEARKMFDEARRAYTRALAIDEASYMTRLKLAQLYVQLSEPIVAHKHLLLVLAQAPDEAMAHLELAKSYMRLGGGRFSGVSVPGQIDASGVVSSSTTGVRARGEPIAPSSQHASVAHHLCAAIDLEPQLVRVVRAMGEGPRGALRGAAAKAGEEMDETYRRSADESEEGAMWADEGSEEQEERDEEMESQEEEEGQEGDWSSSIPQQDDEMDTGL